MTDLPPPVRPLPKLAFWVFERRLDFRAAGKLFGCSGEYARLICLPFDDPDRRVPKADVIERIHEVTQGEIGAADHYPPHLTSVAPSAVCEPEPVQ